MNKPDGVKLYAVFLKDSDSIARSKGTSETGYNTYKFPTLGCALDHCKINNIDPQFYEIRYCLFSIEILEVHPIDYDHFKVSIAK